MKIDKEVLLKLVQEKIGQDVPPLIDLIFNKDNYSEFKLADKLKITVNQVRNILYRLQEHNLVSSTRKKDKKKGWYIYYWTLNKKRVMDIIIDLKKERLSQLRSRLEKEQTTNFFICPKKCMRLNFETAMEYQFKCAECGELLIQQSNTKDIETIKNEISKLDEELKLDEADKLKQIKQKSSKTSKKKQKSKKIKFFKKTEKKSIKKSQKKNPFRKKSSKSK